jgi:inosine-uridine nucleoside N-ribohydrolase
MDEVEKKELAAAIAAGLQAANAGSADTARAVAFTEMKGKIERLQEEVEDLNKYKKENDAVIMWARSFMDNYKRVMMVVVTSGVLTTIALLFQLYYMVNKGK